MKKNEEVPNFITTQNIPKEFTEMSIKKDPQNKILISVLVPVYNTAKTLERTLTSCRKQTLKQIEIVCVDDGSDEETKQELARCAAADARIRVITLLKNRGTLWVRKTLIEAARGEYIMFLDSDDELLPEACEKILNIAEKTQADIIGFGTETKYLSDFDLPYMEGMERALKPRVGKLTGNRIFYECFAATRNYSFTLWSKAYRKNLIMRALPYVPQEPFVVAEDFFLYFILSYFARSYYGIEDQLIRYSVGDGVSTSGWTNPKVRQKFISRKKLCDLLFGFLQSQKEEKEIYFQSLVKWEQEFFQDNIYKFLTYCSDSDGSFEFDALVEMYSLPRVISRIVLETKCRNPVKISRLVHGANCLNVEARPVKTVAFFYHRLYNGGVERVLSALIPLFISWGYNTALIVEEENEEDYPLPIECKKFLIPSSKDEMTPENYLKRANAFTDALKKCGADALLYQATSSRWALFDVLFAKSVGVRTFGTLHELVSLGFLHEYTFRNFSDRFYLSRVFDGIQTLSREDTALMQAFGVNAHFIPNPFTYEIKRQKKKFTSEIIWVGRIDPWHKRPQDALAIMAKVVKEVPQAHLTLLGKPEDDRVETYLQNLVKKYGLKDHVTFAGFIKNPKTYYEKASILLSTSICESWGMVLCEAMSYGVPIVCYEMPYLEPFRGNQGFVPVPQMNSFAAAEAVIRILKDEKLFSALSEQACCAAERLASFDLHSLWKQMIEGQKPTEEVAKNLPAGVQTLVEFFQRGVSGETKFVLEEQMSSQSPATPIPPLWKKAAKFWVEHGSFALARRGMLYIYRKIRNRMRKRKRK